MQHVFFIYVECFSVSQARDGGWSFGGSSSRVPGREEEGEKEGGIEREREGSRDGTRDAVSPLERGRGMWGGGHCLA